MSQDEIIRLERLVMQERAKLAVLHEENANLRSKIAKQRNEIGRLTHRLEEIANE
jgi:predicted RNase H-like nuclease (RuvC/YqgF family)